MRYARNQRDPSQAELGGGRSQEYSEAERQRKETGQQGCGQLTWPSWVEQEDWGQKWRQSWVSFKVGWWSGEWGTTAAWWEPTALDQFQFHGSTMFVVFSILQDPCSLIALHVTHSTLLLYPSLRKIPQACMQANTGRGHSSLLQSPKPTHHPASPQPHSFPRAVGGRLCLSPVSYPPLSLPHVV